MGWIYLLKADRDFGSKCLVKIGLTDRHQWSDRYEEIRNDWHDKRRVKVHFLTANQSRNTSRDEAALHQKFKQYRIASWQVRKWFKSEHCGGDSEWFLVDKHMAKIDIPRAMASQVSLPPPKFVKPSIKPSTKSKQPQPKPKQNNWVTAAASIAALLVGIGSLIVTKPKNRSMTPVQPIVVVSFASGANLRSEPNGEILKVLPLGSRVAIEKTVGNWYKTEGSGTIGWVHKSTVTGQ